MVKSFCVRKSGDNWMLAEVIKPTGSTLVWHGNKVVAAIVQAENEAIAVSAAQKLYARHTRPKARANLERITPRVCGGRTGLKPGVRDEE